MDVWSISEIEERYERLQGEMASPDVARDPDRLRRLGKDLSGSARSSRRSANTAPRCTRRRRRAPSPRTSPTPRWRHSCARRPRPPGARRRAPRALEALLVPKDPNDGKDVVVEIGPARASGAALWAGTLYEMYQHAAELAVEDRGALGVALGPGGSRRSSWR